MAIKVADKIKPKGEFKVADASDIEGLQAAINNSMPPIATDTEEHDNSKLASVEYVKNRIGALMGNLTDEQLDTLEEIVAVVKSNRNVIETLQSAIGDKSDKGHTHDDRYYTESEVDTKLSGKAASSHTHNYVPNSAAGLNAAINMLPVGDSTPADADYYVAQYAGGGTTTTTYHRRTMSALWNYIKSKISSVLGLTATAYNGNSATASKLTTTSAGNTSTPVYFNNGVPTACTNFRSKVTFASSMPSASTSKEGDIWIKTS